MNFSRLMTVSAVGMSLCATLVPIDAQEGRWAAASDQTAQSLIDMERQWAEAACSHAAITQTILADDFQGTSPDGKRYSKAEASDNSATPQARDCRLNDAKVHFFGDTIALVYGSESLIGKGADGKDNTRTLVWTDTWLKRKGKWHVVAAQDTRTQDNLGGEATPVVESPANSQRSARARLLGTWRLVSDYEIRPDGSRRPELYGPHPIGYLMYDKTGHMCVTEAVPDAPRWADPTKPTDKERVITHKGMEAYCGTFEVRENDGEVIHRPELAEWPHYIGSNQIRHFRFQSDDQLILSLEEIVPGGKKYRYEITWRRVN